MPLPRRARLLATGTALALAAGLSFTALPAAADPPVTDPAPQAAPGRYIVTLKGSPIATYAGEVKGLKATRPTKGRKVNARSADAKAYQKYLQGQQDRAAARVGAKADRHFAVALNGFTTKLTTTQARTLQRAPGVLSVVKDTPRQLTDDKNPVDFLRLTGPGGVWESLGGSAKAGKGVVVGVLDSGYWPENPSFAGAPLGTTPPPASDPYRPYKDGNSIKMVKSDGNTFTGVCQAGETAAGDFDGTECNQKVISARYFADGLQGQHPGRPTATTSCRRGTTTATAATPPRPRPATRTCPPRPTAARSARSPASRRRPRSRSTRSATPRAASTSATPTREAIEQAITDGVDVINFSISGSDTVVDPGELAFLDAAAAGIFVSASAGNTGPGPSTLDHPSPWLTTVAASTVAPYAGTVVLGNGKRYAGHQHHRDRQGRSGPLVRASLVRRTGVSVARVHALLAQHPRPGQDRRQDRRLRPRRRRPGGQVRRGEAGPRDRDGPGQPERELAGRRPARRAHGAPQRADVADRAGVRHQGRGHGHPAAGQPDLDADRVPADRRLLLPRSVDRHRRRPAEAGHLRAGRGRPRRRSPRCRRGRSFDFLSGTSMSAPHVAGAAALYFGKQPDVVADGGQVGHDDHLRPGQER